MSKQYDDDNFQYPKDKDIPNDFFVNTNSEKLNPLFGGEPEPNLEKQIKQLKKRIKELDKDIIGMLKDISDREGRIKGLEEECEAYCGQILDNAKKLNDVYKAFPVIKKWVKSKSNNYDKFSAILQACDYALITLEEE